MQFHDRRRRKGRKSISWTGPRHSENPAVRVDFIIRTSLWEEMVARDVWRDEFDIPEGRVYEILYVSTLRSLYISGN